MYGWAWELGDVTVLLGHCTVYLPKLLSCSLLLLTGEDGKKASVLAPVL